MSMYKQTRRGVFSPASAVQDSMSKSGGGIVAGAFGAMLLALPSGSFRGSVRPLSFPAQEVMITTVDTTRGEIILRGAINAKDVFFLEQNGAEESRVVLGAKLQAKLKRARTELVSINFDAEHDCGEAIVRVPVIGKVRMNLQRVAT